MNLTGGKMKTPAKKKIKKRSTGLTFEHHKTLGLLLHKMRTEMMSLFCVQPESTANPRETVAYNKTSKIGKQALKILNSVDKLRIMLDDAVLLEHPDKAEIKHGLWTNVYMPDIKPDD